MEQFTQARLIFLAYEGPARSVGEPGDVSAMNLSRHGVLDLDDLVVQLVLVEISHQQHP
jgi:hypothetical protein